MRREPALWFGENMLRGDSFLACLGRKAGQLVATAQR
jgi:hypothetical protein